METYQAALAETPGVEIGASRTVAGTVNAVVIGYVGSAAFHNLATSSQRQYRGILERLRRSYGDRRIAKLERRHVMHMLDDKAATPVAARDLLRCLRVLTRYAIDMGLSQRPTASAHGPRTTSQPSKRNIPSGASLDWH
jgi:hypothetical protein